jgi:uncharacterized protein (TIGR02996 family)
LRFQASGATLGSMSDLDALLRAVVEDWQDPVHRYILADYLEDQGDQRGDILRNLKVEQEVVLPVPKGAQIHDLIIIPDGYGDLPVEFMLRRVDTFKPALLHHHVHSRGTFRWTAGTDVTIISSGDDRICISTPTTGESGLRIMLIWNHCPRGHASAKVDERAFFLDRLCRDDLFPFPDYNLSEVWTLVSLDVLPRG